MRHSTGKPTKYESQRITAMMRLGCVCCAQLGIWNPAVEVHHIVEGNRRLGHWYSLPLCVAHHRGIWSSELVELIPPDLRVAISDGSKMFEKQYGTERDLWMKVQARLKLPAVWPTSKILPRRGNERHVYLPPNFDPPAGLVEVDAGAAVLPEGCRDSGVDEGCSPALGGAGGPR